MLIYTSKAPGWGKQKPKQWGPLSAVRSAVFANADQMGIVPENIKLLLPMWESVGHPIDVINSQKSTQISGSLVWGGNKSYFNPAPIDTGVETSSTSELSVFFTINRIPGQYVAPYEGVLDGKNGTGDWGASNGISISTRLSGGLLFKVGAAETYADTPPADRRTEQGILVPALLTFTQSVSQQIFVSGKEYEAYDLQQVSTSLTSSAANYRIGRYYNGRLLTATELGLMSVIHQDLGFLSDELNSKPYALLQPVPQTYYFDMGATSTGPTLTAPADTATGVTQPITFSWEAEAGATAYQLQIATDAAFTTIVHDDATLTTTSKSVSGLAAGTLHYWRVRANI